MGMFDELTVEHPLPDGMDPAGISFQTKDTPRQELAQYGLRADGTLWCLEEDRPIGHQVFFHGSLEFYASNWSGSCGNLEMTRDDLPPWRAEYGALYDEGQLLKIEGPGWRLVEGVEHVPRADFDRRCAEMKAATAKPGDDLRREWIWWMSGMVAAPKHLLEAVKWPALEVRLHHLWSHGQWGFETEAGREDNARDLRNWSSWLASETGLTPEAADLLKRTLAFLAEHQEGGAR